MVKMLNLSYKLKTQVKVRGENYPINLAFNRVLRWYELIDTISDVETIITVGFGIFVKGYKSYELTPEIKDEVITAVMDLVNESSEVDQDDGLEERLADQRATYESKDKNWLLGEAETQVSMLAQERIKVNGNLTKEQLVHLLMLVFTFYGDESEKSLDYIQDAELIYAAFLQDYGIDLIDQQDKLHFLKFKALLNSLSEKTRLMQVVQIRLQDLPNDNPEESVRIQGLKNQYKIVAKEKQGLTQRQKIIELAKGGETIWQTEQSR